MNALNILIPDIFHTLAAERPPRENTPALSDDTGSSSSRESSPPATPVSGLSRAPSISFDDDSKHTPTGDRTDIKIVEPDADPSPPEDITRPLKRRRLADIRADELRAERVLPPDILSDATKADYDTSFCLEHIRIGDCTSARDVKPDSDAVHPSLEHVFRPLKRKRLVDMSTDDACAKRAQTSDISSGAANIEDSASFELGHIPIHDCTKIRVAEAEGVHPVSPHIDLYAPPEAITRPPKRKRCADTTADEVGACYILPPDMPQPLVYKYYVVAEDEHPADSCTPKDDTITSPVATACSSYRSLGWHDLSVNLHLMTIRVGREFMKRPLHFEHHLSKDALAHIPTITPVYPDVVEPVFSHIKRDSLVEGISRLPKRKRSPETETDEVPAKRMRMSDPTSETSKVEDGVPFGPHPRCVITGCVSADVEACYILPPDMPQLLDLEPCAAYKYCIITEDEHPPDSCTTMNNIITPSVMTAPCSYRSLGWHELSANLDLMTFRAGQKLSKRPLHYQHVLRDLLPHTEVNHAYTIIQWHGTWTAPLTCELVPDRRLWATGELSPCPKNYYRPHRTQYCSPLLDDDTDRFRRQFRPILSGIKRRRFVDTSWSSQDHIRDAHPEVSIRQWCLECDHARDEWTMGPHAEPEDVEMLAYRQEQAGNVQPVVQKLWRKWDEPDVPMDKMVATVAQSSVAVKIRSGVLREWEQHSPARQLSRIVTLHLYTRSWAIATDAPTGHYSCLKTVAFIILASSQSLTDGPSSWELFHESNASYAFLHDQLNALYSTTSSLDRLNDDIAPTYWASERLTNNPSEPAAPSICWDCRLDPTNDDRRDLPRGPMVQPPSL
ncbi:predicted protein [Postia placenta Mad-698-R]|nr:predicted protein [Postia placenta Mad-698-R]